MDYTRIDANGQLVFEQSTEFLHIPCCLFGFQNTETLVGKAASGRTVYCFQGKLGLPESERRCECGKRMHVNSHPDITLRHLCFGGDLLILIFLDQLWMAFALSNIAETGEAEKETVAGPLY